MFKGAFPARRGTRAGTVWQFLSFEKDKNGRNHIAQDTLMLLRQGSACGTVGHSHTAGQGEGRESQVLNTDDCGGWAMR